MPYSRLYYHFVWATSERAPTLDDQDERSIRRSAKATCSDLGARLHAIGWMPDHVHMVVSAPPSVAPASLAQRLKGASSFAINADRVPGECPRFAWQGEYGVVSFGERALPMVLDYVNSQREHHAAGHTWTSAEAITEDGS